MKGQKVEYEILDLYVDVLERNVGILSKNLQNQANQICKEKKVQINEDQLSICPSEHAAFRALKLLQYEFSFCRLNGQIRNSCRYGIIPALSDLICYQLGNHTSIDRDRHSLSIRMLSATNLILMLTMCNEQEYEEFANSNLTQNLSIGLGIGGGCGEQEDQMIKNLLECFGGFIQSVGQGFGIQNSRNFFMGYKEPQHYLLISVEEKVEQEGSMEELEAHLFNNPKMKGNAVVSQYQYRNIRNIALNQKINILNHFNYEASGLNLGNQEYDL
ncbi:MAG: hypothetical protein EZS28_040453 [Streblomastix strix]|uniref:Uncharacterized protein n=1 Tax=Streblomastix strix TaxID=222440 RepID=A0A5J4U201_9EUKA|nr:MAG: hypothetical protein EZS28_040453 [Streblomastix strix]